MSPAHSEFTFREIEPGTAAHDAALRLRTDVLRHPLGLEFTDAERADEPHCFHLVAAIGPEIVGTLLFKPLDGRTVKMRQVAIRPDLQGRGVGAGLVAFAEMFARERGFTRIIAHARGTAAGFYERLGYASEGEPFLETTLPHRLVTKTLG